MTDPNRRIDRGEYLITLMSILFEPEDRRMKVALTQLVTQNCEVRGVKAGCFMYQGQYYLAKGQNSLPEAGSRPPLDFSLLPAMREWTKESNELKVDKSQISQILDKVLRTCDTAQDFRDALPECLVNFISETKGLPRTRPPAYTLAGDDRATRQFEKMSDKFSLYSVAALLY